MATTPELIETTGVTELEPPLVDQTTPQPEHGQATEVHQDALVNVPNAIGRYVAPALFIGSLLVGYFITHH